MNADDLGKVVQDSWAHRARMMPNAPASWTRGWDEVSEGMRDIDRYIGTKVAEHVVYEMIDEGAVVPEELWKKLEEMGIGRR